MDDLLTALTDAGGVDAPRERAGQLRGLLAAELANGSVELTKTRSGYERPVTVAFGAPEGVLCAVVPAAPSLRADPDATTERAWLVVAAAVAALAEAGSQAPPQAGSLGDALVLRADRDGDPELAVLAFEEHIAGVDRLRTRALALPPAVLEPATDFRAPIGAAHPLNIAHHVTHLGGRPTDPDSVAEHEDAVLQQLELTSPGISRPHEDPDPARRAARRILQRLNGMGKWGGFHTEFAHLPRGFAPTDQQLAQDVGEALLDAGLLAEKPSVGQRHVFLNPRRARDIHTLIERGTVPADLHLP